MIIKVKYFDPACKIEKIEQGNWIDLRAAKDVFIPIGEFAMIPLGVAMELPKCCEAIVAPRSSTFKNFGIIMTNSIGVIDTSYCGDNDQWMFPAFCVMDKESAKVVVNGSTTTKYGSMIRKGDRIAQFRLLERQPDTEIIEVESLDNDDRGGFGSTGKR